jgi:hypothetical protein
VSEQAPEKPFWDDVGKTERCHFHLRPPDFGVKEVRLIWIRFFCRTWIKLEAVNCDPWSALKIYGAPYFAIASSSASTQKSAVMLFDIRQLRTFRLNQSMTATKYTKPRAIGI